MDIFDELTRVTNVQRACLGLAPLRPLNAMERDLADPVQAAEDLADMEDDEPPESEPEPEDDYDSMTSREIWFPTRIRSGV